MRAAGLLGAASGIVGCTSHNRHGAAEPLRSDWSATVTPSASASSVALPRPRQWKPSTYDVAAGVKTSAVRLVETAATWESGDAGLDNASRRLVAAGYDGQLVEDLLPVLGDGDAAVAQVAVAQYGGILSDSASVLVIVNQWVRTEGGQTRAGGTTLDVRLVSAEPHWNVTTVRPARPGRDVHDLSRAARRVLASDHVSLPHAAEADVRSGQIKDSVLGALMSLSALHKLDVSILRSGHPLRVFGTDRTSNHTEGLAVDIWALDGRAIIDSGDSPSVVDFMRAASVAGAYQVGGPTDLDGAGAAYFSDDTHQDHIHLGFTA